MLRWHRSPEVLKAAARWRDRCFMADGSILSERRLWTLENLAHLDRYFVQNLEDGEGNFIERLERQLGPASPSAKQLAAEILWIMYLSISENALTGAAKRIQIRRVWEWSGEPLPEAPDMLGSLLDRGVANPNPGFQKNKWREFAFAIILTRDWKQLPASERQSLMGDPWGFARWLDGRPDATRRQFRHMLLYLLFPEHFERVMAGGQKNQILRFFLPRHGLDPSHVDFNDRTAVDRALYELRPRLEEHYRSEIVDYYQPPVRDDWRGSKGNPPRPAPEVSRQSDAEEWYRQRFGNARVWVIAAGEGGRLWPEFRREGLVAIGWDYLNDLSAYPSRDAIYDAIRREEGGDPVNNSQACWQFSHEMQPGDYVVAKQGRRTLLGYGVVTTDYRFDDTRPEYQHVRDVDWKRTGPWVLPEAHGMVVKTLTDYTPYPQWLRAAFELMDGEPLSAPPPAAPPAAPPAFPPYTTADAQEEVFLSPEKLSAILDALARKKNAILEGAPGVGKTFVARRVAWALNGSKDPSRVEMVQFHQSYAYEDFVQGWRPQEGGGFELRDGVFHRFCQRARQDPENRYVFLIDEINRGNLSKVFGELMMLIEPDKRGPEFAIPLTYARSLDDRFSVPKNLYLLGMMNTADRSLAMVDYALRRRFGFIRLDPAFQSDGFTDYLIEAGVPEALVGRIVDRMTELNRTIAEDTQNLGPGFEIGHSFFVPDQESEDLDEAWYGRVIRQEIEPLLHEYWFDQPQRVKEQVNRLLA